jgi:electron transfer flavoprotein beta subunit
VHILVCLKQVVDQDIPPRAFRVNRAERRVHVPGAPLVMSLFDANALEVALQLRDNRGAGSVVTALSLGPRSAEEVLRRALGCTANTAVLLYDPGFLGSDPRGVATAIAAAARRLAADGSPVDVILTGRQAGDWEHGQTGGMIAEALGWPCVTFVSRLRAVDGDLEARREVEDGYEIIHLCPPFVATVTNDQTNRLRLARARDVMLAHRAAIATWGIADLNLDPAELVPRTESVDLVIPERQTHCERIEGHTAAEKAGGLARRLRELGII